MLIIFSSFFVNDIFAQDANVKNENMIIISSKQQKTMGIQVASLLRTAERESQLFPGKVVIPVGQERIVSSAVVGLIDDLGVAVGSEVKKGQLLGHITSIDMLSLQREYLQASTQQQLTKKTFNRDADLFKEGIIAERRYLNTQNHLVEANTLLSQLKQSLKLSGMSNADIKKLGLTGKYANGINFTSPMDGQVLQQLVTIGQRVDSATPLYKIGRLYPLWLEMRVPVDFVRIFKKGMLVKVPSYGAEGNVIQVVRNINSSDQNLLVRAEITSNTEQLSPGQLVEAEVVVKFDQNSNEKIDYFAVSKNALVREGLSNYIFVQTAKGFTPTKVSIIFERGQSVVIGSSDNRLKGNERVAVSGSIALKAAWLALSEDE